MYFSKPTSFLLASCLLVTNVIGAPGQKAKRDDVYPGYCTPADNPGPQNSGTCYWQSQDGSGRAGEATCDSEAWCGVNTGQCYYNYTTKKATCPTGED